MKTLEVVVGAQYGSEAKGHVVQRLTERAQKWCMPQVIRVAGPNAGHTGYDRLGQAWALRQVPVAAVTEKPAVLGIAAGSEIDLPVLLDEYDRLRDAGLIGNKMLWVAGEATLITDEHKEIENMPNFDGGGRPQEGTNLVGRIGSTGKGIGAARADRIMRKAQRLMDSPEAMEALGDRGIPVAIESSLGMKGTDEHVIIEGTQGYALGLRAGHYPQCTSSDCRAIDFMAMAGVHPWSFDKVNVWAVARIYPIRVAGNSGPLKDETSWKELGLNEEHTTVTKKVRRVGGEDWDLVARSVRANGGHPTVKVALTMLDQKFPEIAHKDYYANDLSHARFGEIAAYVAGIQSQVKAEIGLITTGPDKATFL